MSGNATRGRGQCLLFIESIGKRESPQNGIKKQAKKWRQKLQLLFLSSLLSIPTLLSVALLLTFAGVLPAQAQSRAPLPPPSIADFSAPFEDPLHTLPAHYMQYPNNLIHNISVDCVTADQVLLSHNADAAVERLLQYAHGESESGAPIISLQLALDLGLCHNPQVRMTWSGIKIEASRVGQAKAAYLPQLNAAVMPQRSIIEYPTQDSQSISSTSGNIGLSWRVLDFGIRSSALESAYHQLAAATHSQNEVLQKTIIEILQTYYEALTKKSQWLARTETVALSEQTLASSQRRLANGAGSKNDVLQAQSSLSRSKLEETKAQGEYKKALATLIFMLGLPANTAIEQENTLEQDMQAMLDATFNAEQKIIVEQGLQEWLDQATYAHPSIAAARSKWIAAQQDIKTVSAQGLPTVDIGANYYRNGRPTDSASSNRTSETSLTLTVNIPLFSGFDYTYRVRGAQAEAERARLQMEAIEQQVMLEIIHTHADAQSTWHNLSEAENFYNAALLARESSQRQFENGVVDISQVIQAQAFLVDADMQRIEAYAQWQIAKMTLIVQSYAW